MGGLDYALLWWFGGGEAGRRLEQKKTKTGMFLFFSSALAAATAADCSFPFEPLRDEFATGTTAATTERREWRE